MVARILLGFPARLREADRRLLRDTIEGGGRPLVRSFLHRGAAAELPEHGTRAMDATALKTFQSLADEVKAGFAAVQESSGEMRVVHGYLESKDILAAYRPLCLPVRRASKDSDRMSFRRTCRTLEELVSGELAGQLADVAERYEKVMRYMASHTILNDRPVEHREVFEAWLDAVIYGEFGDKDQEYRKLMAECGKAVEGIAVRLTEAIADRILELDEVIEVVLREHTT